MANKIKKEDDKLTRKIVVRCTDAEYKRWKNMAETHGVTMSKMMRSSMDGNKVQSKSDAKAMAELRKQGGLLKKILIENPNLDPDIKLEIRNVLRLMIATMNDVMGV